MAVLILLVLLWALRPRFYGGFFRPMVRRPMFGYRFRPMRGPMHGPMRGPMGGPMRGRRW